jgi:hypothetical protein
MNSNFCQCFRIFRMVMIRHRGRTRRVLGKFVPQAAYKTHRVVNRKQLTWKSWYMICERQWNWEPMSATGVWHPLCNEMRTVLVTKVGKWSQIKVNDGSLESSHTVTLHVTFILYIVLVLQTPVLNTISIILFQTKKKKFFRWQRKWTGIGKQYMEQDKLPIFFKLLWN